MSGSRVSAHASGGTGYQQAVSADSRSAYYRLDDLGDLVADQSGHGQQAGWQGGVALGAPGLQSGDGDLAMGLDGSSGYVSTPIVNQGWSQLTVEAWFRLSSTQLGTRPRVVANSHTDVDLKGFQLELDPSTGTGFADVGTGSGEIRAAWAQQLTAGATYHYVLTYDGSTVRAYLNGVQVGSGSGSGAVAASSLPVDIGKNPAYSSDLLQGAVDEVAIYSQALSGARVSAHYAAGNGYDTAYSPTVLADVPAAYYRLDDLDGAMPAASGFEIGRASCRGRV